MSKVILGKATLKINGVEVGNFESIELSPKKHDGKAIEALEALNTDRSATISCNITHIDPKFKEWIEEQRKIGIELQKDLEEANKTIDKHVLQRGQYSHNIISLVLRDVAKKHGYEVANNLVDEHNLELIFGIPKVELDD